MTNGKTRPFLYIMVFLAMGSSLGTDFRTKEMEQQLNRLELKLKENNPILNENSGRKFYVIDGKRAYIEINGKSASSYDTNNLAIEQN